MIEAILRNIHKLLNITLNSQLQEIYFQSKKKPLILQKTLLCFQFYLFAHVHLIFFYIKKKQIIFIIR